MHTPTNDPMFFHNKIYIFFFFDNLGCPGQRSVDTHTSTNPRGTRNTLLACISQSWVGGPKGTWTKIYIISIKDAFAVF